MCLKLILSLLIWIANCTQFLSENRLDGCQIFGWFGFCKTESKQMFGFLAPLITRFSQCYRDYTAKVYFRKVLSWVKPCLASSDEASNKNVMQPLSVPLWSNALHCSKVCNTDESLHKWHLRSYKQNDHTITTTDHYSCLLYDYYHCALPLVPVNATGRISVHNVGAVHRQKFST